LAPLALAGFDLTTRKLLSLVADTILWLTGGGGDTVAQSSNVVRVMRKYTKMNT
jgi:hypothetical protein